MKSRTRASVVVVKDHKVLTFFAVDPHDGREFHFLPGGTVDPEETAPDAAERETLEETGYKIDVEPFSAHDEEYDFKWNGEVYHCLTIFYRGYLKDESASPEPVNDASYNKHVVWVPVEKVTEVFAYSPEILRAVETLLR